MHTSCILSSLEGPLKFSAAAPIPIVNAEGADGAVPLGKAAATAVASRCIIPRP